ncbi:MAG: 50S ribosomal protein L18e [Promethearchaeota archaeon]
MNTKSTNEQLQRLLILLKRQSRTPGGRIWRILYERLQAPRRTRVWVNVADLQRHYEKGYTMAVPGKVLSEGIVTDKLQVAALSFSSNARTKIVGMGGKCLSLEQLMETNPSGKNVKLIV